MNQDKNWKRPVPGRSQPQRQWSAQMINQQASNMQQTFENLTGAARAAAAAYIISEKQMNEGKEQAKCTAVPGSGTDGGFGSMQSDSFYALSERLMRDAMLWFEFLAKNTQRTAELIRPHSSSATGAAVASGSSGFVSIVASEQPVEISFTPQNGAENRPLGVHELRAMDPDFPGIAGLEVEFIDQQWRVSVTVDKHQPAGLYTGIVFDREDGSIRGSLAVSVHQR